MASGECELWKLSWEDRAGEGKDSPFTMTVLPRGQEGRSWALPAKGKLACCFTRDVHLLVCPGPMCVWV